ncbi:myb-like protein X isoform X3 [Pleuronectes platessa]|uniref:myb-like protein X isoform X3 n=1 Tax=Pleuronectes platessa TaxID=8262 RepID=UPI00232A5A68|nr:myb-like protein X isoform X3 [Pleuronectes platessa]
MAREEKNQILDLEKENQRLLLQIPKPQVYESPTFTKYLDNVNAIKEKQVQLEREKEKKETEKQEKTKQVEREKKDKTESEEQKKREKNEEKEKHRAQSLVLQAALCTHTQSVHVQRGAKVTDHNRRYEEQGKLKETTSSKKNICKTSDEVKPVKTSHRPASSLTTVFPDEVGSNKNHNHF